MVQAKENKPHISKLAPVTEEEFKTLLPLHKKFITGHKGGERLVLKFKDLRHFDFSGLDLREADFTGSCFSGTNMSHATFKNANFFNCDMRDADLSHSDFRRCDMRGTLLSGANMTSTLLEEADLREGKIMMRDEEGVLIDRPRGGISGAQTILTGARLTHALLNGVEAHGADFSDADLSGAMIKFGNFEGASFSGANFTDADVSGTKFNRANLSAAILTNAILDGAEFFGTEMDPLIDDQYSGATLDTLEKSLEELLNDHHLWVSTAGKEGTYLDLSGYDLRDTPDLKKYALTMVKAVRANFLHQDLHKAQLQHVIMDGADFRDCDLKKADMRASSFKGAFFTRAEMRGANFSPLYFPNKPEDQRMMTSDLSDTSFRYADVRDVDFSHVDLRGADFSFALVDGADFSHADLSTTNFHGASLNNVNFTDAILPLSGKPLT